MSENEMEEPLDDGDLVFAAALTGALGLTSGVVIGLALGAFIGTGVERNDRACDTAFYAAKTAADTVMVIQETDCRLPKVTTAPKE